MRQSTIPAVLAGVLVSSTAAGVEFAPAKDLTTAVSAPAHADFSRQIDILPTIRLSGASVDEVEYHVEAVCPTSTGGEEFCFDSLVSTTDTTCTLFSRDKWLHCTVPTIASNGSVTPRIRVSTYIWNTQPHLPVRNVSLRICADPHSKLTEGNDTNNCSSRSLEISRPTDLGVGFDDPMKTLFYFRRGENRNLYVRFGNGGSFPVSNVKVTLSAAMFHVGSATIRNLTGDAAVPGWSCTFDAGAGTAACTGSVDGRWDTLDTLSGVGDSLWMVVALRPKSSSPTGSHPITARVDPDGRITESSETDNTAVGTAKIN